MTKTVHDFIASFGDTKAIYKVDGSKLNSRLISLYLVTKMGGAFIYSLTI